MDILSFLQSKGLSRRAILLLLQAELIKKNGKIITYRKEELAQGDEIKIKDADIFIVENTDATSTEIVLFHKPCGYVVSKHDTHNHTIYELLPEGWKQKYTPIGRLDKDSHGLLILTNDTKIISYYAHPRNNHKKIYIIKTYKQIPDTYIHILTTQGVIYYDTDIHKQEKLSFDSCQHIGENTYRITLHGGKKRHIRRAIKCTNNELIDLKRIQFGPWKLPENILVGKRKIIYLSKDHQNLIEN